MQKLIAVEEAKILMRQAKEWGVWRWLMEKKSADNALDALGDLEKKVKASWNDDMKKAYRKFGSANVLRQQPKGKAPVRESA